MEKCVVLENIHTTPMEGISHMTLPPLWIFQNQPPKFTLVPSGISKIFLHPLEILLSLIEGNWVVLFSRMPNFLSFVYFLLNSIYTHIKVHSLCKFLMPPSHKQTLWDSCIFRLLTDKQILYVLKSPRNCWKSSWPHANEMQDKVRNTTVFFSHDIK